MALSKLSPSVPLFRGGNATSPKLNYIRPKHSEEGYRQIRYLNEEEELKGDICCLNI
jgi:hypothetical protein